MPAVYENESNTLNCMCANIYNQFLEYTHVYTNDTAGTYDIQTVSVSPRPGSLEVDCTFTAGSQTSICQVTLCKVEQGAVVNGSCQNVRVPRNGSSSTQILDNLQIGVYTVQAVLAEDTVGVQTQFTSEDMVLLDLSFNVQITESTPIMTTSATTMLSTGVLPLKLILCYNCRILRVHYFYNNSLINHELIAYNSIALCMLSTIPMLSLFLFFSLSLSLSPPPSLSLFLSLCLPQDQTIL